MTDWRAHLTSEEREQMERNKQMRAASRAEDRKIYDRARKRAKRAD